MHAVERNKDTVKAYVAAMNAGDFEGLRKLFTSDALIYGVLGAGSVEFAMPIWHDLHHGLNMHLKIESISAEGNVVAVRYTETGKWTGRFLGFDKPTGKSFELVAMEWFELSDGKIARRWGARDGASQARQLGFPAAADPHAKAA